MACINKLLGRLLIVSFLVLVVVIFASCSVSEKKVPVKGSAPVLQSQELDSSVDLCKDIVCPENSECNKGYCVCDQGFKVCNNLCISSPGCCIDGDCEYGSECKENRCTKIKDNSTIEKRQAEILAMQEIDKNMECETNKVAKNGKCTCKLGTRYCAAQDKCIPLGLCCGNYDCSGTYCRPYTTSAKVCFNSKEAGKSCKVIPEGYSNYFDFTGYAFQVNVTRGYFAEKVDIDLNGQLFKGIPPGGRIPFNDEMDIYVSEIAVRGGDCVSA